MAQENLLLNNLQKKTDLTEKRHPAFHLFLYLIMFFSLGFVLSGSLTIFFQLINKLISDPFLNGGEIFQPMAINFGFSSLLVATLIFHSILFLINKKLTRGEIEADSKVRKIVTYLAAFILSMMGIGSLVALINSFLNGEISGRSVFKILIFFGVSTFYFIFYFWEIRRKDFASGTFKNFYAASICLTLVALISAFLVIDKPSVAREKLAEDKALSVLSDTSNQVVQFYQKKGMLPKDKAELKEFGKSEESVMDENSAKLINPQLSKEEEIKQEIFSKMEYLPKEGKTFSLCYEFKFACQSEQAFGQCYYGGNNFSHPIGKHCFEFTVPEKSVDKK